MRQKFALLFYGELAVRLPKVAPSCSVLRFGRRSFRYESCALLEPYLPSDCRMCTHRPSTQLRHTPNLRSVCAFQLYHLLNDLACREVVHLPQ